MINRSGAFNREEIKEIGIKKKKIVISNVLTSFFLSFSCPDMSNLLKCNYLKTS